MEADATIVRGIPLELVDDAVAMLCDSFDEELRHGLRPRDREQLLRIVRCSIEPSRALAALDDRGVAGVAALGHKGSPFMRLRFRLLAREFGVLGALPRRAYALLDESAAPRSPTTARIDVLAVREDVRGRGIGSALIAEAVRLASDEGMRVLALEVTDVNGRARRLYERQGFVLSRTVRSGPLTAGAGYRAVLFMRRPLP